MCWVFNVKYDDRYRSRLVVMVFHKKPGIYYFDSHYPVMNEVTFRLLLILGFEIENVVYAIDIEK